MPNGATMVAMPNNATLPEICETLYDSLQVSPRASTPVIKAAWRCLAQVSHPDKHHGSTAAGQQLTHINHAYAVLSDPAQRLRYDQAIGLHLHHAERRGGSPTRPVSMRQQPSAPQTRSFAFRPFA